VLGIDSTVNDYGTPESHRRKPTASGCKSGTL
jgi:hypothetical protein